jgi:hypothetical protein
MRDTEADRPVPVPPVETYQCCHCGGAGLDSADDICPHCEGLGFC